MISKFPNYKQMDVMDCGATCLRMIFKYYGQSISIHKIRKLCQTKNTGVNLLGISEAAEKLGFRTYGVRLTLERLQEIELPCILHWNQNHFVVLYKVKKDKYYISDPALGHVTYDSKEFGKNWYSAKELHSGLSLILSPGPEFYQLEEEEPDTSLKWGKMFKYFYKYKRLFTQLILGMVLGTILQLITPFLTQSVVDIGINIKNISFINLILIAQLMLFVGSTAVSFIRSWILLHISTRVNISILTDLLIKIMKLPMNFFDIKTHGDLMQRMADQQRIETFLTGNTLNTLFSIINMLFFGALLIVYNKIIFLVFFAATVLYTLWILFFMKYRRELDNKRFKISSENQTYMVEMIQSIKDIKLNNAQKQRRWGWEALQAKLFKFKVKSLALSQYQSIGSMAINQIKGIIITFISAKAVIDGHMTLGGMMAVQYIVGMVSSPVESLLGFMQSYQDAKISMERLNEIYETEDEEDVKKDYLNSLPANKDIEIRNLTFRYYGAGNEPIFSRLNLHFPAGKTTAIVGTSGSGKTTILKLLLRFYEYEEGEVLIGGKRLEQFDFSLWRDKCGAVLQDNYVYADTIERNITVNEEFPDRKRLENAIEISNLNEFIAEQPFGLATKIGTAGKGVSQGQRQRLMIARAVFKEPEFIFLDEATNSLDANNEKVIIEKLNRFFQERTVIVVAHRLSTVKNADNIIVLEKGNVVEQGTHADLTASKGKYFELVRNQLELGD
ncbi:MULTISPECIES: peptidase domain-containing ABC transporter [Sphingobacterium]|uniref:peptidase domain-containing ABC transporter n=1 Tax=Sphingobacterium TaxID=28453 RepID=UPI0008A371CB|nr:MULTISPECIES: peptidase domain-containing ABC transporter [Sphingobacterium]OFV17719.1 ABC transporter ATP-binding protein [Sphingobacterium sp. HMSC13C05]HAL51417.1 peptidase domain-containing ABC transporter [Sphingobacterium sp.]